MKIFFLRHATAEHIRPGYGDALRRLMDAGRQEAQNVGAGIRAMGLHFDVIRTSPLVRARETAELVADSLGQSERLEEDARLSCGCHLGDLESILTGIPESARVLLVGHQPDLGQLIQALTGGRVRMKQASLACVETRGSLQYGGELCGLWTAEDLQTLLEAGR